MLNQISTAVVRLYLLAGTLALAFMAANGVWVALQVLFEACYTILPDGTRSDGVDSFHLRTWLLGIFVPSYRRTALVELGKVVLLLLVALALGFLALMLGLGLA